MKVTLIRHFESVANREKFYSGTSDVGLVEPVVITRDYPHVERVVCSTLRRAVETAGLIYGKQETEYWEAFKEMDFGDWTFQTFETLKDNPHYRSWIDNPTEVDIPGGETYAEFRERVLEGFGELISGENKTVALVSHGGVISCILSHFAGNESDFYSRIPGNGECVTLECHDGIIKLINESEEKI